MTPVDPRLAELAAAAKVRPSHIFHCWHAMAAAPEAFDPNAFAEFCQLDVRHITAIVTVLSDRGLLPPEKPVQREKASRGTRLPEAFQIPPDWLEWAQTKRGWSVADARAEADLFVDYWQAKAGKEAVKLDWEKTWHVWVRNSRRADGLAKVSNSSNTPMSESWSDWAEKTAALYDKMGRTNEAAALRSKLIAQVD